MFILTRDERGYSSRKAEGKPKFVHRNLASETPNAILTLEAPRGRFAFVCHSWRLTFLNWTLRHSPRGSSKVLSRPTLSSRFQMAGLVQGYSDLHIVLAQLRTSLLYMHASILPWFDCFRNVRNIIAPPMLIRPWTMDSESKGEPDLSSSLVQVH